MKNMTKILATAVATALLGVSAPASAKLTAAEAARLGTDLTPMGAEKGANADGTIPAWQRMVTPIAEQVTGTMSGLMAGQGLPEGLPGVDPEQMKAMMGPLAGVP